MNRNPTFSVSALRHSEIASAVVRFYYKVTGDDGRRGWQATATATATPRTHTHARTHHTERGSGEYWLLVQFSFVRIVFGSYWFSEKFRREHSTAYLFSATLINCSDIKTIRNRSRYDVRFQVRDTSSSSEIRNVKKNRFQ